MVYFSCVYGNSVFQPPFPTGGPQQEQNGSRLCMVDTQTETNPKGLRSALSIRCKHFRQNKPKPAILRAINWIQLGSGPFPTKLMRTTYQGFGDTRNIERERMDDGWVGGWNPGICLLGRRSRRQEFKAGISQKTR